MTPPPSHVTQKNEIFALKMALNSEIRPKLIAIMRHKSRDLHKKLTKGPRASI